jgi:hypothetical protein
MPAGRPSAERQLPHCREEGLNCRECVSKNAAHVASLAAELNPSSLRQIFHSLYPDRACTPMAGTFIQVVGDLKPGRRGPAREEPLRFRVAVA